MRIPLNLILAVCAGTLGLLAQTAPSVSSDITKNMDLKIDPCTNFYQYACGGWMASHPIPPEEAKWGSFEMLALRNREILRDILEKASANDPKRDAITQKIGDFYFACMDEEGINRQGLKPVEPLLASIAGMKNKNGLAPVLARLQYDGIGVLFGFGAGPDLDNSNITIADIDQGGLSLPDRDYYLKTDAESVDLRKKYLEHLQKMFEMAGDPPEKASHEANAVLQMETSMAKGAMERALRRNPLNIHHMMSTRDFAALTPAINWQQFFEGMKTPAFTSLNVGSPDYFRQLQSTLAATDLDDLKAYLRWHVLHEQADLLPTKLEQEEFAFFGKTLTGALQDQPRWRHCVHAVDVDLGFALGEKYVDRTFGVEGKQRTLKMVQEIEGALKTDVDHLTWMTPATKKEALIKLAAVTNKIGYPDKWRDYSSVRIDRHDAVGNDLRATEFERDRTLSKIGKPPDRKEWGMTPPTVNAYYSPQQNSINFPAGILQPPFYDNKMDNGVNYGGIGVVVGHELTHGFDDSGRRFDPAGNVRDWWTPEDAKEFEKRAQCFIDEYSSFVAVEDVHLNGKLTLGENSADNGGMRLAFSALMDALKQRPQPKIDNLTAEQRFFLGFAQVWCQNVRPAESRRRAIIDPHSPGEYRVNGTVQNMPEFQQAFACKVGQPMVREPACRVW